MKNTYKILSVIGLALLFIFGVYINSQNDNVALGSIEDGQAYNATTTYITATATSTKIKFGQGTFGSVIVSSTTAGTLKIQNATSTTDSASTTLAIFGASPTTNTYTYDASFDRGLFIELSAGFAGSYTITYR